jgi:hypothetical protein
MKTLREGHKYELAHTNGDGHEIVQFIEKRDIGNGILETVNEGTSNEEVIRMLINRMMYLNEWVYDPYNSEVLIHLQNALNALHARTADRVARGVEGTAKY